MKGGCKVNFENSEAASAQSNFTRVLLCRKLVITTLANVTMSNNSPHPSGLVADYEEAVLCSSILLGGKCVGSGTGSSDIEDPKYSENGPIVPKRLVDDVDGLFYIPFASLPRDFPRLQPAKLPNIQS